MVPDRVKVLLVEDDEDDFVITRDLLRDVDRTRFEIDWIPEFDAALKAICNRDYDVCLVDYRLGEHDGVEFIRAASQQGCKTPIILLTAQGDREVDLAAMEAGAGDFLHKTQMNAPLLERSIRYTIQQRRSEAQRIQIVREQTARREAEAANRAKDEFLATLSHELRTPLNAILGWAQLLATGTLDEETTREALEAIERNARSQAQLIEDLLDVSRIVSGKVRLENKSVELPAVINAAIDAVRLAAEERQIVIQSEFDPDVPCILGDPTRLQQVAWNLLSNAIKFSQPGGTVQVKLKMDSPHVQLIVRDFGAGIEPEFLPRVFDRFRQADTSTTRKHTGLGLGLAIVRHLVELHGGTVQAHSDGPGTGATFTATLPLISTRARDKTPAHNGSAGIAGNSVLQGLKVLVVDDQRDTRAFLSKALELHGAEVATAGDVPDAMNQLKAAGADVVVTDIAMPREDGYSLLRQLRELDTATGRHTPAIAITAHAAQQDRESALASGFAAYLAKPILPESIVSVIANLAGRIQAHAV